MCKDIKAKISSSITGNSCHIKLASLSLSFYEWGWKKWPWLIFEKIQVFRFLSFKKIKLIDFCFAYQQGLCCMKLVLVCILKQNSPQFNFWLIREEEQQGINLYCVYLYSVFPVLDNFLIYQIVKVCVQ